MRFSEVRASTLAGCLDPSTVTADPAGVRWVEAATTAARGDLGRAETLLDALLASPIPAEVRFAACITLGSVLRQTGRHAAARARDDEALGLASADGERADALIGLAADAVGLGDADGCAALLARAAEVAPPGEPRIAARLSWVRTEHALLIGDVEAAASHARAAVEASVSLGSARHVAKSKLFLGAALDAAGSSDAERWLADAERIARTVGAGAIAGVAQDLRARRALR